MASMVSSTSFSPTRVTLSGDTVYCTVSMVDPAAGTKLMTRPTVLDVFTGRVAYTAFTLERTAGLSILMSL